MRLLGTGLLLLALFASGCSSESATSPDDDGGPNTPSDIAARDTSGEEETPDDSEDSPDDATGDPLRYSSTRSRIALRCFPAGPRDMIVFDDVRARRPVTLTGATVAPDADALQVTGAWLAAKPRRAIDQSGFLDLDAGGTSMADIDTWADRVRLPGARMEPGTPYTFFVRVDVRADRSLGDISLGWNDGDKTGASAYDFEGRTRSGGC